MITNITYVGGVADAVAFIVPIYKERLLYGYDPSPITTVTHAGKRALYFTSDYVDGPEEWVAVVISCEAANFVPARYVLMAGGFEGLEQGHFQTTGTGGASWSELKLLWELSTVEAAVVAMEDMCDAVVALEITEDSTAGGEVRTACAMLKIQSNSESCCAVLQLIGTEQYDVFEPIQTWIGPLPGLNGKGSVAASISSVQLGAVAQGVEDLAHKTTSVSLNNGGAIAVIDSSEVIVP